MADPNLEPLRKALRQRLRDARGDVSVPAAELRAVLDELGRLQQANERLRRQNRRVRVRLQRAGLVLDDDAAATDDAAADDAAAADAAPDDRPAPGDATSDDAAPGSTA